MRVFKPLRLGLLTKTLPHDGAGLFVISTFSLFDLQDPTDILAETALWPMVAKELPKGAIFDAAFPKPFGEFLIAGRAMAREPVPAMHVSVSVGDKMRQLAVFGDRYWQATPEGAVFTQPVPFSEMALTPDRAYGGEGHSGNPAGCGASSAELFGHVPRLPLPNVELSGSEIRSVDDQPSPALVGPIALDDPARMALTGTFTKAWASTRMPEWPEDFDPRYYMSAPRPQQFDRFFTGVEPLRVAGMSAECPDVQSQLPGIRARAFVALGSKKGRLTEVPLLTDTVWIFGSELKGVVVNRGMLAVADRDATDVDDVMIAYEWLKDEPRPAAYYQDVYNLRCDPEEGYKYLLADSQLSPTDDPVETARREQDRVAAAEARQEKWAASRQWRLERQFTENGLPASLVPAMPEADTKPFILPSKEDIETGNVDFARLISDAEDLRREAELKSGLASAEILGVTKQLGVDIPDFPRASLDEIERLGAVTDTGRGFLPDFEELLPHSEIDRLLETFEQAAPADRPSTGETNPQGAFEAARDRFLQAPSSGLLSVAKGMLDNLPVDQNIAEDEGVQQLLPTDTDAAAGQLPSLEEGAEDNSLDAYLARAFPGLGAVAGEPVSSQLRSSMADGKTSAHTQTEGMDAARQQVKEAEASLDDALVAARRTSAEAISPLEPVGPEAAELLGQFIRSYLAEGGALAGRDLAGAALSGISCEGADLTGSFLEGCDLAGAGLRGIQGENAVFTGATLAGADLGGANLPQANLSKVAAAGGVFREARFRDMTVVGADFTGCDLSGADLDNCTFIECRMADCRMSGARLANCAFLNSDLKGLSAVGAHLERTSFLACALEGSDWSEASLRKVSFANVSFSGAVLKKALLDECGWFGPTDMAGANFSYAQAAKCGFQDAKMQETAFFQAVFNGCNFSGTDLAAADMRLASLTGSLFAFASVRGADLFAANLLRTSFRGADLTQTSFRGANFYQADLSEASLAFADFTGSNLVLTNNEAKA